MAEAICKMLLARRLGCKVEDLPERGFEVVSAGLAAFTGDRAAEEAIEVIREMGGDLSDHFSHPLTADTVYQADYVFTMTDSHMRQLANLVPEATERMRLLRRDGGNIADPVGMAVSEYRRSAQDIEENLIHIVAELLP
jgi:protein-tyrosine-phosphatase